MKVVYHGPDPVHLDSSIGPVAAIEILIKHGYEEILAELTGPCCMGSAVYGVLRCTCWEPIFDLAQEPVRAGEPTTRSKCCADCAYRNDSPERADDFTEEQLVGHATYGRVFWCHQGMRRAISYRHPCGLVLPTGQGDYQPPIVDGVPYLADGSPGERCAGWSAYATGAVA